MERKAQSITAVVQQPVPTHPSTPEAPSFRRVLKNRNFLLLWLAQLTSLTVLNAANFGIIVLVSDQTHSVIMAGLAIITFTLPAVPFSVLAGVIVDRLNKRLVLLLSNVLRILTMLLILVTLLFDRTNLWPLYILTFTTSLIGQFFTPAEGASIPLLVGERELMPALSLFNITVTLAQVIGYLLLGSIVARIFPSFTLHLATLTLHVHSIDMLFVVVAFFYLICTGLILCISPGKFEEEHLKKHVRDTGVEAGKALEALWRDVIEGWRFVRNDRMLYFSVIQLSVGGDIMLLIGEVAGPFVQQALHRPAADMSIILAPAAIGLLGAPIIMPRITERIGKLRLTVIGFIVLAVGFVLLPATQALAWYLYHEQGAGSPLLLWTTICLAFILGVVMACINIPTQALMQERSPVAVRGRIFSLQFMMYNAGGIPILLLAGFFAQFIGFNWLFILLSANMLLFCLWGRGYLKRDVKK